jgi:hypothetical protein
VQGIEFYVAAVVTSRLQVTGSLSLLRARYTSFCDNAVPFDRPASCQLLGTTGALTDVERAGDPLDQAPEGRQTSASRSGASRSGRTLALEGSYSYQSSLYFAPGASRFTPADSISRINLRGVACFRGWCRGLRFREQRNERQTQQALIYSAVAGNVIDAGGVTPPRVYGVGLSYNFYQ